MNNKYLILDTILLAQTRMQEMKTIAETNERWLPEYDALQITILNQITSKGACLLIDDIADLYTVEEQTDAAILSNDWYLKGLRQVILDITDCPKTGLKRKVFLRQLIIDSGEVMKDTTQPVEHQCITGFYNIVTLTPSGDVFAVSTDKYLTNTPLSLTKYDYYLGAPIAEAVLERLQEIFGM